MPFWVPELGYEDKNQLFDIEMNVLLGCRILKYYLEMENGDLIKGLARYNGSVGKRWYADHVSNATDEVVPALNALACDDEPARHTLGPFFETARIPRAPRADLAIANPSASSPPPARLRRRSPRDRRRDS